ncbi:DNA-3-methyladenine glycosylase I [Trifolium repens]|nr:DNA-3-methyladenine glycosylase I [Trifolium repens]
MPIATKLESPRATEPRAILKPGGNIVTTVHEETTKRKKENLKKKTQGPRKQVPEICDSVVVGSTNKVSSDTTCSSDSSSSGNNSLVKKVNAQNGNGTSAKMKRNGFKMKTDGSHVSPGHKDSAPSKRCDWITPNSDPLYSSFHDEEWGVPVIDDDRKLFELLVYSQALAEHTWPAILNNRDIFRKLFENFDPSSIAQFTEKNLVTPKINGNPLLSEQKLRAIVENAKQLLKVQLEFGSFSNYCWKFVNHKPIRNEFRYGRQIPVKTPKAELISKDMMRRGFQCVGPKVVYSFMQVSGLVNDHLLTCFRHQECNMTIKNEIKTEVKETKV